MSKDSKNQDPSFGEFWNELIHKSDLAKENAGRVASEFKNLGILQSKKKLKQQSQSESNIVQDHGVNRDNYMREHLVSFVLALLLISVSTLAFWFPSYLKQGSSCEAGYALDQKAGKCVRTIEFCANKKNSVYFPEGGTCRCIDGYTEKDNSCIKFLDCSVMGQAHLIEGNTCRCDSGFVERNGQCVTSSDFCSKGGGSLGKIQEPNMENPTCSCAEGSYWNDEMKSCEGCAKLNNPALDTRGVCPKKTSEENSFKDLFKAIIH